MKPSESSWYLKHIIIHDLQTRYKTYFICEKWFALDKDDFKIERNLFPSLDEEKRKYKYLLAKQAKQKLSDEHLWFSIFARPVQSSFTRLDRLTCCFVLLSISMLMNIMYYGVNTKSSSNGIKIGSYVNITVEQISVGVITSLIVFPPSLLLVQMFKRIKRRHSRIFKIKEILNGPKINSKANEQETKIEKEALFLEKKKQKSALKFPWWFRVFAYMLSFAFAGVSLFFVIVKGLVFGNEMVTKWITSIVVSLFTSVFLTQPIKVNGTFIFLVFILSKFKKRFTLILKIAVVTFIFVTLCRKFDDKNDLDNDGDNAKELNKYNAENEEVIAFNIKNTERYSLSLSFMTILFNEC
jgi:polycystin 1L2